VPGDLAAGIAPSLIDTQRNYQDIGSFAAHSRRFALSPSPEEPLAPTRPPNSTSRESFEDRERKDRTA
jgi:hypothetical protein